MNRRRRREARAAAWYVDVLEPWTRAAVEWLHDHEDERRYLEAWEDEHVLGDGQYGTHDWPGWADTPVGPCPGLGPPAS